MKKTLLLFLFIGGIAFAQVEDTGDKVGIGTTTPEEKLDVNGKIQANGGADAFYGFGPTSSSKQIDLRPNSGYPYVFNWHTGLTLSAHSYYGGIRFYNQGYPDMYGAAELVMSITDNNVGIGTATPAEKLQVSGNISAYDGDIIFNNSSTNQEDSGKIRWNEYVNDTNESGAYITYNGSNNILQFMTNTESTDYEHLRIVRGGDFLIQPTSGNVGIGTITPGTGINPVPNLKLEVNGGVSLFSGHRLALDNNHYNHAYMQYNSSVSNARFLYYGYYGHRFEDNFGVQMVIEQGGNVGIGTTTPDEKLAVNGNIHTKEVRVDLNGWSDFVFESNYNLPTLKEVEQHIKDKGHLKDIPSAEEVKKNGILLGDMDSKLLQKIEELTLYAIEQQKSLENKDLKIKNLEEKLDSQEARLKKLEALLTSEN